MLPSLEFIWKVFVSLFAITAGILAMYWVCVSALDRNAQDSRSEFASAEHLTSLSVERIAALLRIYHTEEQGQLSLPLRLSFNPP